MQSIYTGLLFTCKEINSWFKIKVNGIFQGKKINTLVGVSGLIRIIGVELVNKLVKRAFACKEDKCICKLRRGIKVSFYTF